ncbi:MAG TPA: RagB/SusD family nutrient uptake outer membrane protein [Segetibacter sp.]
MKSIKITLTTGLLFIMAFSSCKKEFLDLKPYNALPLQDALKSEADLVTALNGMYAGLRSTSLYGRLLPVKGDLMADNIYVRAANSGRFLDLNDYNIIGTSTTAGDLWGAAYIVIKNANTIINSPITGNANINQFKGEALAVRALVYFELVRNFAKPYTVDPNGLGVPLITTFDQNLLPARNTIQEVYKLITDDLAQAYSLMTFNLNGSMPITGGTTRALNSSFMTKYAARALQAKVYMHMGDWNNAKTAALDVVQNSGVTLVSNAAYIGYWRNPSPLTSRVETLFEITNDVANNTGTNALAYMYDQAGYGDLLATNDLVSKYRTGDVRLGLIITTTTSTTTTHVVNKYSNTSNASEKDDIKVLRYSDVLLILAEAYARTNDEPNARLRLNQLAQNREPAFAGYTSTGTQLINDIILERRKELAFEGDRFYDLQRLNLPIVKVRRENPNTVINVAADDFRRIFPIPQGERDVNPNIRSQQNPGYQ